ncbi:MAG: hypothetical protein CMK83_09750 [Pseudomonadales bacterium]|uniref:hypothetical protein n=1 Tax=unclassified Ketobacter TaxID=2639109 RepID=UPI000C529144|nr:MULTISPECIES: hypothetical protein [unclassified Ketobacter]MAQ24494.1 hypothetical protein [Pseudomonadales bacterium]MEC8813174.1 hypothetical protein [Pseudomonadota bacterium]HAG93333.1 hypothetical protein [Gammaproteobacteria bacterium]MBI25398.1 hypothetical protein [Pseudomonadales bacterium]RLT89537.1 MAG: hypothetical protein D9N13_12560 [Ketobacter sp. GenoA1]
MFSINLQRLLSRQYFLPFILAVGALSFYAYSIRQQIMLEPLSGYEAEQYARQIQQADVLEKRLGPIHHVEMLGGLYEEQRARCNYGVMITAEKRQIHAELWLYKKGGRVDSVHLVHLALSEDERFSIQLDVVKPKGVSPHGG